MSRPIRFSALALVVAAAIGVAGCGNNEPVTSAETEGTYLDLGGMKYQVQISRFLNPNDTEDQAYLQGAPAGAQPGADSTWFGVFMRVENDSDRPLRAATDYEIVDTQNNVYRPVPLDDTNSFAYRGGVIAPESLLPNPDSPAGFSPIQGALVLFKVKNDSLQNRPLVLHIADSPQGKPVTVDLDL